MNISNNILNDNEYFKNVNLTLDLLKKGQIEEAQKAFSEILKKNFSNQIADSGIKCCKYWIPRLNKIDQTNDHYEKGKQLFSDWKNFELFMNNIKNFHARVKSSIMFFVFNSALEHFKKDLRENRILDLQTSYMIALSYKKIGDYENAIKYFEEALSIENNNSNVISQLADCYALIDEEKKAKILFREAFFIDPSSIELEDLDSNIITSIISKMLEMRIPTDEMKHWIPVYGRVLEIFNIHRELIPSELNKLKREIFYLEKHFYNDIQNDNYLKAKLLNYYFWLHDYLILINRSDELTELEYKIKFVSEEIYNLFTKKIKLEQEIK